MKRTIAICLLLALNLAATAQPFAPNWASLNKRGIPSWFHRDKFGIFIHWGVYAVPAYAPVIPNSGYSYSEWYWNRLPPKQKDFWAFHTRNYGENFTYPDFEKQFRAELYNPQHWADIFRRSGARYVVLTSKHHEGYALWNSPEADKAWGRPWNAVTGTPKRDLLGDLTNAVKDAGLKMGYYYSLYEWFNPLWLSDKDRYVREHMHPQFKDLVNKYKPSVIFSDGEWDISDTAWRSEELLAWLFNESPVKDSVVVNDRWGKNTREKNTGATYTTSEYGAGMNPDVIWEESQGIGHSYGYNRNEQLDDYKTGRQLILLLADVVARGGNLLLDIGPTADGRIPVIMQERLLEIGNWLQVNGEAIYGTEAWKQTYQWSSGPRAEKKGPAFMAGYDIGKMVQPRRDSAYIEQFYTRKGKDLFVIVPEYRQQVSIQNFKPVAGTTLQLLGSNKLLKGRQAGNNMVIDLSSLQPGDIKQTPFVIKMKGGIGE
ncbi:alpha-L-fucosidase [Cnuella takakiae]|uniref:alpha-L-fucosidase n=1 Tax=Cnuella takakiae TaxID=1302690 RepID=A0A1M5GDA8_9BACT|nr:alpha-L-fucosidase [Cnuella takakiae]OLY94784.1 alpha-L-fucosidase [Cnuella takakiae]SHG01745.1 alpha-L-fucosidase [Cnuella takakiae]